MMRIVQILVSLLLPSWCIAQGVGINNDGSTPDPSAMLDVKADSAGILIPRTDTSSIVTPANGLLIYDTSMMCFYYYKVDKWVKLVESTGMRYYFRDQDGDGYGDKFRAIYAPDHLPGYAPDSTDCNDLDPALSPGEPDLCDEIDNDCDPGSPDGSGDVIYQTPCDGPDADLCAEGIWECNGEAFVCSDNSGDNMEICDGMDNDCNPSTADGAHEPMIGTPCDGPDADLCTEGVWQCVGGTLVCSDNTGDNIEVCDGNDNDCNPATPDGSGEPMYLTPCDGPDADLCTEGVWECNGVTLVCSDNTDDTADLCDGIDNDCNPATADGADEPLIGMPCDGPDADFCTEGVWECIGGTLVCSDNTGDNVEVCDGVDNDCDGQTDECPPFNTCIAGTCTPCCANSGGVSCATSSNLGSMCGDQGSGQFIQNGCGEAWFRFILQECNSGTVNLKVTLTLSVPSGMDYDLRLYADNCTTIIGSSTNGGTTTEMIQYSITDTFGTDNTTSLRVHVSLFSGVNCGQWTLTINGNL